MELVLLEVLEQHATGAVDDALRDAGGARREEHVPRVVEREALRCEPCAAVRPDEVVPCHRARGRVADHDGGADGREAGPDLVEALQAVEPLAAVAVAVGREQHDRLDLSEPVEHPAAPKSGEVDEYTAPIAAAPSMTITASSAFGNQVTTRSPGCTPRSRSADAIAAVSARNSSHDRDTRARPSRRPRRAPPLRDRRRRVAAGGSPRPTTARRERTGCRESARRAASRSDPDHPTTPQSSHTSRQNPSGSAIDHACNAS